MVRCRRPLILTAVVAVAAVTLLAAGCGGGSPGVANIASSTTATASSAPATTTTQNGTLAFSHCMRSHGVPNFPDPGSSGEIPKPEVVAVRKNNPSSFDAAQSACRHLLPGGSLSGRASRPVTAQQEQYYLRAAACMRSHGYPTFPDPTFQNNNVTLNVPSSIDTNSSEFKRAATTCTKLIPAGLPYSRSSGS